MRSVYLTPQFSVLCYVIACPSLRLWLTLGIINHLFVQKRFFFLYVSNHVGGVMVSVFASSVVDRGFESRSGQIKD